MDRRTPAAADLRRREAELRTELSNHLRASGGSAAVNVC